MDKPKKLVSATKEDRQLAGKLKNAGLPADWYIGSYFTPNVGHGVVICGANHTFMIGQQIAWLSISGEVIDIEPSAHCPHDDLIKIYWAVVRNFPAHGIRFIFKQKQEIQNGKK